MLYGLGEIKDMVHFMFNPCMISGFPVIYSIRSSMSDNYFTSVTIFLLSYNDTIYEYMK